MQVSVGGGGGVIKAAITSPYRLRQSSESTEMPAVQLSGPLGPILEKAETADNGQGHTQTRGVHLYVYTLGNGQM